MSGAPLLAGMIAGLGIALPVGAITVYLVGLAARTRFSVAAGAALGVATTDGAYALAAVLGGRQLEPWLRPVSVPLAILAAGVLVLLGARVAWTGVLRYRGDRSGPAALRRSVASPLRAYAGFVILTGINPTTVVYFLALVLGQQGESSAYGPWDAALLFAGGALLASAAWQLLLAGGGVALGRVVSRPRAQLLLALSSGLIMLGFALTVLLRQM